jgi:hypothetical protein
MLLCYNYQNDITYEEENIIFTTELELFSIGIINLLNTIYSMKSTNVEVMDVHVKINNLKLKSGA